MVNFAKFDPRAFLEKEMRASANKSHLDPANTPRTLAGLATLAATPLQNEKEGVWQSNKTNDHRHHDQSRKFEVGPAKVAKVAKAEPRVTSIKYSLWGDAEEERAAVAEYDGGASRRWAEALARLDPACAPCDVSPKRWLGFIDDCGRFLDEGWAERAEALGWSPLDLFGCDRIKPSVRLDRAGLLWLIDGRKLLALTADTAAIATASGSSLTFRRCSNEPGRSLAWELET